MQYKVTVIIPMYGVEKFIAKCAHSLLQQTLPEVQYIFVNDATTDNTIAVLKAVLLQYPHRVKDVSIITHEVNKGLPAARNTGLAYAQGEYVFHGDGDDFVETNMLEMMYSRAVKANADIVWSDYFLTFDSKEKYMKQPTFPSSLEALKGMLIGSMKYNVWNKLVRRNLYIDNGIQFPAGFSMGEDMTMIKLFLYARRVVYLPEAFYHYYQGNSNSITASYSSKHLSALYHNATEIFIYIKQNSKVNLDVEIACLKLLMKWIFLLDGKRSSFKLWLEWFPEANRYIDQSIGICRRIRFIEKCAARKQFWIVWLHYWLVCRFYYGIIYR